jgi:hypothetical protein
LKIAWYTSFAAARRSSWASSVRQTNLVDNTYKEVDVMASYGIPDNPSLTTHSWVRAWWLHSLWGYKVLDVRRNPKEGWFGRLTYEETIRLVPTQKVH